MAITLSKTAKALTKARQQRPQLVLEIDGLTTRYGIGGIKKYIQIGDAGLFIDGSWTIGGYKELPDQEDLITFDGSSSTITQQLLQDKGGTGSVSSIQIALIDKDGKATELISPGVKLTDILGATARVYLGYQDTAFPQDFAEIFSGIVDEAAGSTTVVLNIAHPEAGKRFDIFQPAKTTLTANVNYLSATVCGCVFQTRSGVVGLVNVTVNGGGAAGAEIVTVTGTSITITIESGVSTASQIRSAVENYLAATSLVNIDVVKGQESVPQTPHATTTLNSDTTINVDTTEFFLDGADGTTLQTYIRIDDEVIQYTGRTGTAFTGCTRGAFVDVDARTLADFHSLGTEVTSFYRLQGNALDLALKIMLSGEDQYFITDQPITSFCEVPGVGSIPNAIYFEAINIQDRFGLVPGDYVTTTGDDYAANNVSLKLVSSIVVTELGSYMVIDGVSFVNNPGSPALINLKSKYNVLPKEASLGMTGAQVDVPEFERLKTLYSSSIFSYDFYLTDVEQGKDFIDTELLFPTGGYSIPRKGKVSVGYTNPPLAVATLPILNSENTVKPSQNKMTRSINKYFYNNVVFKYNPTPIESDRYLSGNILADADSRAQIQGIGNKTLAITSRGLRPSTDNDSIIANVSSRLLDRYKFAAEYIRIGLFYGDGFALDVGDSVLFGDAALNLVNTKKGTRGFTKRIFEIVNKSLNIKSGEVALDLVDTNYSADGRYGVFSPSSQLDTGSTTTVLKIKNSYATESFELERDKWLGFIGEMIRVHSEDYSFDETVKFLGFDPTDPFKMQISPALSVTPPADYIIDLPEYYGTDEDAAAYKSQHCFFDPSISVVTGISNTVLTVSAPDAAKFFVGAKVLVHDTDFTVISPEVKVLDITGTTITFDKSLGFIPDSTYSLELIGFVSDLGPAYRYL